MSDEVLLLILKKNLLFPFSQTCIKSCCSHLQTAQFAQDSGSYTCKNTPILTGRSLAAQTEFANLTLIATKPRVRSSIERGGALGGNGLCSVNDTKILVEDFELEGNKIGKNLV